jgi:hypothetical protein
MFAPGFLSIFNMLYVMSHMLAVYGEDEGYSGAKQYIF